MGDQDGGFSEGSDEGSNNDEREGISLGELIVGVANIRKISEQKVVHNFSPALCKLIYLLRQREMLREKLVDLRVAAAAAANSGMVTNAHEIIEETNRELRELIAGNPED